MGIFDDGYEAAIIEAARNPVTRPPAGFFDAFHATYEATRQEDLSISARQNFLDKVKQRNELIRERTGNAPSVTISEADLIQPGTLSTTAELARKAYNQQVSELSSRYPEIKTDDELRREIKEDSRRIRERRDDVAANSTWTGKLGSFTGAMAASLTDPLVAGSMFLGPSASAGILRTALVNAGLAAGSEALIQPFVYRYKQELESPYSVGEAIERVAGAGVGGAAVSTLLKGAGLGLRAARNRIHGVDDLIETFEKNVPNPSAIERDAAFVLGDYADTLRESPFTARPDLDDIHLKATAKALSDIEANRAVDVQEFTAGIEPREELRVKIVSVDESRQAVPTENQSLSLWVKNHGGVSIEKAGALRGEYEALFESGGGKAGAIKRKAGKSPDELAQLAHEAGFIGEPDPARLAEALGDDFSGNKVYSVAGDRFERRLDLQLDREFQAWAEMAEKEYLAVQDEIAAKARGILEEVDVMIAHPDGIRSARQVLQEFDQDLKAARILEQCLIGGGNG